MTEEKEVELSLTKIYSLPCYSIVHHNDYYLAIFPLQAKWIVMENEVQVNILHALNANASIEEVMNSFSAYEADIISVLTQIEAKHIENISVKSVFSNTRLHLHLTNRCNLRCPHCYMKSGLALENELSTNEIKELCTNFSQIGGTDVSLTGGEPSIHPDFLEIAEHISRLGMKISIFTNGFGWTEESVNTISKLNLEGVQISIDGFDEETNSQVRGIGVFSKALNTLDMFIKHDVFVKIAITAPYDTLKRYPYRYHEFAKSLLDKYGEERMQINFSSFFMEGRDLSREQILLINKDYSNLVNEIVSLIYPDIDEDSFVYNIEDSVFDSCGFGGLNVMANGDFYFCDRIPDVIKAGNIREMSFDDIYSRMMIAEKAGKIDNFKPCGSCELKYICGGGCRADYFADFTKSNSLEDFPYDNLLPRTCSKEHKNHFYDLMIQTNERFFE